MIVLLNSLYGKALEMRLVTIGQIGLPNLQLVLKADGASAPVNEMDVMLLNHILPQLWDIILEMK
jgi:hypothetical protein